MEVTDLSTHVIALDARETDQITEWGKSSLSNHVHESYSPDKKTAK